ncbi:unnamed protein product [Linum trigynum]|uniref:DUF4283 domain-containing protein n=1 Tax=Linum trigynum TaxID=586398 RepID=A0AAV2FCV0_9ROSI
MTDPSVAIAQSGRSSDTAQLLASLTSMTTVPLINNPATPSCAVEDEPMIFTEKEGSGGKTTSLPPRYAGVLTGVKALANPQPAAKQWLPVGEHDLIPGEHLGEPALKVSPKFKSRLCAPWQRALVVRLMGIKVGYTTLCSRLRSQWRPIGSMEVMDLNHDCFLVKLENEQDYFKALTNGPWTIFYHYILVQQWSPRFKTSDPLPKKMIVSATGSESPLLPQGSPNLFGQPDRPNN